VSSQAKAIPLADALAQAVALHRGGRVADAMRLYDAVLAADSRQFDALRLSALILADVGHVAEARARLDRAVAIRPASADAQRQRAHVCKTQRDAAEALTSCERALALRPDDADLANLHAAILLDLARFADAAKEAERAIALHPANPHAHYHRALALQSLARPDESLAAYDEALRLLPGFPEALHNRGNVLHALGRDDDALASWDSALAQRPDFHEALHSRALLRLAQRHYDAALADFERVVALAPDFAQAWTDRGMALDGLRRYDEALASCERALAVAPPRAEGFLSCGIVLAHWQRYDDAVDACTRALALVPDMREALHNRALALQQIGRYEEAAADLERELALAPDAPYARTMHRFVRMHGCDWRGFAEDVAALVRDVEAGVASGMPLPLVSMADAPRAHLACAQAWAATNYPPAARPLWTGERYAHERVRVAYLSADLQEHATAYLLAEVLEHHDRTRFEVTAVSWGAAGQRTMRGRLSQACDRFLDVRGESDAAVARRLRELEIDIAVDLKGYTHDARPGILAHRCAPVQVSWLGYPGTLGASYVDYVLADATVTPEASRQWYAEQVAWLPDSYQPNDRQRPIAAEASSRKDVGLPEAGVVFCSFNNNYKITPAMFEVWMRLLRRVEGSVLWLLEGNAAAPANLRREAEARGVGSERLVFAARANLAEHLARHRLADLFLDTLPYNAHTTASDALWAGLPVVTCMGEAFAGRVAASLLRAAGLPELVTATVAEYEELAYELATQPERLAAVKAKLAAQRETCALFDSARFARHLESAFTTMHERALRGEAPSAFAVAPLP